MVTSNNTHVTLFLGRNGILKASQKKQTFASLTSVVPLASMGLGFLICKMRILEVSFNVESEPLSTSESASLDNLKIVLTRSHRRDTGDADVQHLGLNTLIPTLLGIKLISFLHHMNAKWYQMGQNTRQRS